MKNKIFTLFIIFLILLTSSVFAVSKQINKIDSDIYGAEETRIIDSEVEGNVFLSLDKFEMSNKGYINGNLYLICDTAQFKSKVNYSNSIAKDGSYSIEAIDSYSAVDGNVYMICDEFILEPGSEINGDLYIIANKIDIQKSSTINGNLFAVSEEIILNGKVNKSVYATANNFNMNYYGSISKDLHLTSENVVLSSVISRDAYIDSKIITTNADFLLYGNLEADSDKFNFSGEIDENANINSKELKFINNVDGKNVDCLISGNLNYSCKQKIEVNKSIVLGEINSSPYVEKTETKPAFSLKVFVTDLITFVVYVFVIALIFKLLNKNYPKTPHKLTIKNTLGAFGIGILSFIIIAIVTFVLLLIPFGLTLSFALLFAYLFLLFIAIPVFVLDIAVLLNDKLNLLIGIILTALLLFLISSIPVLGGLVMFIVLMAGVGRIWNKVLFKKV